ncbi:MAG: hypothetical protein Q4E38_08045 [Eubacteriales bacterium]|nr:hypothetical protein [Eubacteriales bacterium]
MYFIMEIQGNADGSFAHLVTRAPSRLEAESEYHRVLSAAAVSGLPMHSAVLLDATGTALMSQCYTHEPEEEGN